MINDKIKEIVENTIKLTPLEIEEVEVYCDEKSGSYWCAIKTKEPKFFIGRDGEFLLAWNHLIRRIIDRNRQVDEPEIRVIVDVNNYQKNKVENLRGIAHMLSEQARYFKSSRETEPMSAFERRTIHEFLADKKDIQTESTGTEPNRLVVIRFVEPN